MAALAGPSRVPNVINSASITPYHPNPDDDDDVQLYRLIAELALEDLRELEDHRKGKGKDGAPPSDADLALRLYEEEVRAMSRAVEDRVLAQSIDSALATDHALVQACQAEENQARDDRRVALALSQGIPVRPAASSASAARPSTSKPAASSTPASTTATSILSTLVTNSGRATPKAPHGSTYTAAPSSKPKPAKECTSCRDKITGPSIAGPCGHPYDVECITDLVEAATRDQSLFPIRCCTQPIPFSLIRPHLSSQLALLFEKKEREYNTVGKKIYCSSRSCGAFVGAATSTPTPLYCPECYTRTCGACNTAAHPFFQPCATDTEAQVVLDLAREEGWQRCPQCHQMVELAHGCFHMTCRCRAQFCYVCAKTWKTCQCPQWDENRLVVAARRQVEAGIDPRREAVPQAVMLERVQAAVEDLRVNHEHQHGRWGYRSGGGQCEECGFWLPQYLFRCGTGCGMMACNRCRRNRL